MASKKAKKKNKGAAKKSRRAAKPTKKKVVKKRPAKAGSAVRPKRAAKRAASAKKAVKRKSLAKGRAPKKAATKSKASKNFISKAVSKRAPATKSSGRSKASSSKKKSAPKTSAVKRPAKRLAANDTVASPKVKTTNASLPLSKPVVRPPVSALPRKVSKAKPLQRNFLMDLANAIKESVTPLIVAGKGRGVVGTTSSGDACFELDKSAEETLLNFLKSAKMPVAYYSEDAGYTTFISGQPTYLLAIDPIDGTRAAKCGFESCAVSICSTRIIERPTIGDVDNGCVVELLGSRSFFAERGKGARIYVDGHIRKTRLSENTDLESVSWAMTVPARPADLIFPTVSKLIDITSLKGGFFACNSTAYSLTRLLTNQLDACIDFANRYYRDIPSVVEDYFINAGRGSVLGVCPYDLTAALLIAQEAGCVVTDAYGDGFDDVLLLDSSVTNQRSVVAAANPKLHKSLLNFIGTRIEQYEALLKKRAGL